MRASPDDDIKMAREFIESMQKNQGYFLGLDGAVQNAIQKKRVDSKALLRGAIQLLKDGKEEERGKVAYFLGRLGDKEAVGPLVDVLADPNASLREDVCIALQWLHVKGEPAEPVLVRLRAEDPSLDVRVAAAFALGRPPDEKSIATFKEGIEFTKKPSVRSACEDELESIGRLELPLPEKVYVEINSGKYIIGDPKRYVVQRKCKKGDTLYFEAAKRIAHVPLDWQWYRVKLSKEDLIND
jgi:HEAT repeat protein